MKQKSKTAVIGLGAAVASIISALIYLGARKAKAVTPTPPPPAPGAISITGVTWQNNIVKAGDFALVKAAVTVNNLAAEFTDKLSFTMGKYNNGVFTPASDGVISKQKFMTAQDLQAELAWFDAQIADCESKGATSAANALRAQKARVQGYQTEDGFVFIGNWNITDPNAYFDTQLTQNAGNKTYKYAEYAKSVINDFVYPTGQYAVQAAFTIWTGTKGGDFDVLVKLEGQNISYVCPNAISIIPPVLPNIISIQLPPIRAGAVGQAILSCLLPNPLNYPAGIYNGKWYNAGSMKPRYTVSVWCPKLGWYDIWTGNTWYWGFWFSKNSSELTSPDGMYVITQALQAIWGAYPGKPIQPGQYALNGSIMASQDFDGSFGAPQMTWDLGVVGTLVVT